MIKMVNPITITCDFSDASPSIMTATKETWREILNIITNGKKY